MSKEIEYKLAEDIKNKYNNVNIIINEEEPYTLYSCRSISQLLDLKNIRSVIRYYSNNEIIKKLTHTNGGKQIMSYLTYKGLMKLLSKSRKEKIIEFAKLFNLDLISKNYLCAELDTITCIMKTFSKEVMITQYKVGKYKVDLYFVDYKLVIECDENHSNIDYDTKRQLEIESILGCKFIRYKPHDKNFNIFHLLNDIYKYISGIQTTESFYSVDKLLNIIEDRELLDEVKSDNGSDNDQDYDSDY
jgi:very-short-patch-repair endonuclease